MLGGGADRSWLEPLDAEGNRRNDLPVEDQMIGCHLGNFAGLNVLNPQPGFEYEWMLYPPTARNSTAASLEIGRLGGSMVREGDPEYAAFSEMEGMQGSAIDTAVVYNNELVLVRIPVEKQRARMAAIEEKNQRMLRKGPEDAFVGGASGLEQSPRYNERGPTRFAMRDHQTEFKHDRDTVEISIPSSGIVRTGNIE
jgi:hypothetical protein